MTLAERLLARVSRPVGRLPEYIGARCLRRRFIRSTCDICARECPVQALYPGEGTVRLDAGRCTGCLACAAVCPSEALVVRDSRPAKVAARIFALGERSAVLGCEKGVRDGTELLLPCLGMLSQEELALFALLSGSLTLLLHPCRGCHSPGVPELLQGRVDQLRELWEQEEQLPAIELLLEPPTRSPSPAASAGGLAEAPPANANSSAPSDRRDFFRAFKTLSVQAAAETWGAFKDEPDRPEEQWASSKHVPAKIDLLAKGRQKLTPSRSKLLLPLLTMIEIGGECTLCEACVGLCPSGAISSGDDDDQRGALLFAWSRCSACGLCREFCPARAITLRRVDSSEEPSEKPKEIFRRSRSGDETLRRH